MELPSLYSPERKRRRWLVLGEFAKYAFCGLKRKRRDFERSVLKYVSIKIPALTHSGHKSRVCVNQPDRLTPNRKATICMVGFIPGARWILFSGKEDKTALRECACFSRCDEGSYG